MGYVSLDKLKLLYADMDKANETRRNFRVEFNKIYADVIFLIDEEPYVLAFGILDKNIYFELSVNSQFKISDSVSNYTYLKIIDGFNIKSGSIEPFYPRKFFEHIRGQIPQLVRHTQSTTPKSLKPHFPDIEEADKIFFIGFRDNNLRNEKVSIENLDKTRRLLGQAAFKRCKEANISSCWTDEAHRDKFGCWKTFLP